MTTTTAATAAIPANTAPAQPVTPTTPVQPKPTNGATGAETPIEKFKLKDGEGEREFTRAELERRLGKTTAADRTISKLREWQKEQEKKFAELQARDSIWEDDEKLEAELAKRGKLDKFAVKRVEEKYAEHQMTPEQREAKAASDRAEAAEKKLKSIEAEQEQQRIHQGAKIQQQRMESMLVEAATRAGRQLPDPDLLVALNSTMGEWMEVGLLDSKQPFTAETADALIDAASGKLEGSKAEFRQALVKGLKGQALEDFVGKDVADELIRYRIELRRNGGKPAAQQHAPLPKPSNGTEYKSPQQLREEREARMRG